jgi:uncharacterized repeat protein (TIGR03803 family)
MSMTVLNLRKFSHAGAIRPRSISNRRRLTLGTTTSRRSPWVILLALAMSLGAFSRQSVASEFDVLRYFTNDDGAHPFSDLVQGSDGALYGTTVTGNNETDHDTIFKINPDGSGFAVLMDFDSSTTGANCWGGLLLGSDGALYGTTYYGGTGGGGTVFKIEQDGTGFAVLKNFDGSTTGGGSYARLTEVNKVLYGTTFVGGTGNAGTLFRLEKDGTSFAVIKHFDNSITGGHPTAAVIVGRDGALYGTALHGGSLLFGTIFKINTDGTSFTVLKHMNLTGGGYIQSRLLFGSDGELYGTASEGGTFDAGTVFTLHLDGSGFTVLKSFEPPGNGAYPYAGLIEGSDGKLFGTTLRGGRYDWGTVFEMNPDGSGFRVLKRFDYATTGGFPYAGVTQLEDGALYGATGYGWDDDFGSLFRLLPTPNEGPTAVATADLTVVLVDETVNIDGSGSSDPDGDDLAYQWTLIAVPSGSVAEIVGADTAHPTFTPDVSGEYKVSLTVTESLGLQSTAGLSITATDP